MSLGILGEATPKPRRPVPRRDRPNRRSAEMPALRVAGVPVRQSARTVGGTGWNDRSPCVAPSLATPGSCVLPVTREIRRQGRRETGCTMSVAAPVAQWIERHRPKVRVGGSSPSGGARSWSTCEVVRADAQVKPRRRQGGAAPTHSRSAHSPSRAPDWLRA